MICPKCRRSFYFLEKGSQTQAQCVKCHHRGAPQKISYEDYHTELYSKPYRRTLQTDPQMHRILKALAIEPNDVVIDLGCGVGDYTQAIHFFSGRVAGYDRDINAAQKKYPHVRFFELNFSKEIPLPDACVDKIVSINVIEHLLDWDFFLRECYRVLRPGGIIALSTANRNFLLHDLHYDKTHYHEWTLEEFKKLTQTYFKTIQARKDCAMFNYYPVNFFFKYLLKPDLTWIGRKVVED